MAISKNVGNLLAQRGIIVHDCNCLAVMDSGIGEQLRNKYPYAFFAYEHRFDVFGLQLGDIIAVANPGMREVYPTLSRYVSDFNESIPMGDIVVYAMTQYDYGQDGRKVYVDYLAVEAAFARIRMLAQVTGLVPNFSAIGCGQANGSWDKVEPRILAGLGTEHGARWDDGMSACAD